MSATVRFISPRFLFLGGSILSLALILAAAPAQAVPRQFDAEYPQAQLSASQRALNYDHRTSPKNVSLLGRFNAADYQPVNRAAKAQLSPPPKLFMDLEREVKVDIDAWYGKAGLQIDW